MPYKEKPDQVDDTLVFVAGTEHWVRCPQCARIFFYIEKANYTVLVIRCSGCKRTYRIYLGVELENGA